MNLNTFLRHSALANKEVLSTVVEKLQNPELVKKAKVFPYQLFSAYKNINAEMPSSVSVALQKATEFAIENIPAFEGKVYVMVDTSGSMKSPITGDRGSVTSKMQCVDVAALVAASVLRKNPDAEVIPFDTQVHKARLNPLDSIMTNAEKLAKFGGGGTYCAKPLEELNARRAQGDLVIYVSDNESWVDSPPASSAYGNSWGARGTATMQAWNQFKARPGNKNAKLVCIDLTPNGTTQANDREDILNIGGFSDTVFDVIAKFVELGNNKDLWIKTIESVKI
jgi:60 kDa SS-A/Ro ribonucleoprotein